MVIKNIDKNITLSPLKMDLKDRYVRLLDSNNKTIESFCKDHKYIYRYLPFEWFLDILHKKHLAFISPSKWNDPFDNFLFERSTINPNTFLKKLYVGCFTLNPHSQAYWKTYAPEGYSVRIRFETKKLFDLIKNLPDRTWFGKLNYRKETEIIEIFQNTNGLRDSLEQTDINDIFLDVFTLKRKPFEYESEVRIIIESNYLKEGVKKVKIDLKELISDIYLDPRIKPNEEIAFKKYIKEFGFVARKSQLFQNKNIRIQ